MFVAATGGISQLAVANNSKNLAKQAQNLIANQSVAWLLLDHRLTLWI